MHESDHQHENHTKFCLQEMGHQIHRNDLKKYINKISCFSNFNIFLVSRIGQKLLELLRVSEANEVPISSHIWVALSTFNQL